MVLFSTTIVRLERSLHVLWLPSGEDMLNEPPLSVKQRRGKIVYLVLRPSSIKIGRERVVRGQLTATVGRQGGEQWGERCQSPQRPERRGPDLDRGRGQGLSPHI